MDMFADISEECDHVGLAMHVDKTKVIQNGKRYGTNVKQAKVSAMTIEVLGTQETTMYLGRSLSLIDAYEAELQHRIRKAWDKNGTYKEELTKK